MHCRARDIVSPRVYSRPQPFDVDLTFQSDPHFYALRGILTMDEAWQVAAAAPAPMRFPVRSAGGFVPHKVWLDKDQALRLGTPSVSSWSVEVYYAPASSPFVVGQTYSLAGMATAVPLDFDPKELEKSNSHKPAKPDLPAWMIDFQERGIPIPTTRAQLLEAVLLDKQGICWPGPGGSTAALPEPDEEYSPRFG